MHIRPRTTPGGGGWESRAGASRRDGTGAGRIGIPGLPRPAWAGSRTGVPADSRSETGRTGGAGNSSRMRDQSPERDVWSVFADVAGVETRLLCWAGLDGAASVRFLELFP